MSDETSFNPLAIPSTLEEEDDLLAHSRKQSNDTQIVCFMRTPKKLPDWMVESSSSSSDSEKEESFESEDSVEEEQRKESHIIYVMSAEDLLAITEYFNKQSK